MARLFATVLFFAFPLIASAAILSSLPSLFLSLSPLHPVPGQPVIVTVKNVADHPDGYAYIWSVDGQVVEQGIGLMSITVRASASGQASTVTVTAVAGNVPQESVSVVIRSADVDLMYEGDTATPPFFGGRPLPNGQDAARVFALPNIAQGGSAIPPSNLIYRWSVNGAYVPALSGYGKQSANVVPPAFGSPFTVSLHVETKDGLVAAENQTVIEPIEPSVVMYRKAPLLGILLNSAVGEQHGLEGDEVSFFAQPLYANTSGNLTYAWRVDGDVFEPNPENPLVTTIKKIGSGRGSHSVEFSFENANKFLIHASKLFHLTF